MKALAQLVLGAALALAGVAVGWWMRSPEAPARVESSAPSAASAAIVEELRAIRAELARSSGTRSELAAPDTPVRVEAASGSSASTGLAQAIERLIGRLDALVGSPMGAPPGSLLHATALPPDLASLDEVRARWSAIAGEALVGRTGQDGGRKALSRRLSDAFRLRSLEEVVSALGLPSSAHAHDDSGGIQLFYRLSEDDDARHVALYFLVVGGRVVGAEIR